MELRHVRHFVVLAEELHFGRAAQRLSITQPPLSASIRVLEGELGLRLFERDSKHVSLTPAGAAFYAEVHPVLDQVRLASCAARSVAAGQSGYLEIGFAGSTVYRAVPEIVSAHLQSRPAVEVILREMSSVEQLEALQHGRLHGGFVNLPVLPPELAGVALADDHFVCCLPVRHPLAQGASIDLATLAGEPFVMFARDAAPSIYDNVISICLDAGFQPITRFAVRQWLTVVALVANGLGVALVPACVARSAIAGARFLPFTGPKKLTSAFFIWHPARAAPVLESFISTVRSVSVGNESVA